MANSVAEAVIGAVVLATAAGFVFYAGQSRGVQMGGDSTLLHASFRSAEGITVGTDVRLAGINVGSVTGLELDPATFEARTSFTVDGNLRLPANSDVKIASESLLGGNYVEITPGRLGGDARPGRRDREHARVGQPPQPPHALRDRQMTPVVLGMALALAAGQAVAAQSAQVDDRRATVEARVLHLRGLDNLNGTVQDIDMAVGETTRFGHLEITAEDCRVPRAEPEADAFAFLRDPRHPRGDAALLRVDVRLLAGALGARPPALRRLGARVRGVIEFAGDSRVNGVE